ncbi:hypothetical protein EYF80_032199 [Liparis tanakae]|uniref:Uncharacterized protein n=1 Tax=Liparis tanakae TaxID=230148 RepID=A0A4Z2GVD6_9TELE|nr:hypothetical protein EYF80_032199 [Liparis tanakae]
MYCVIHTPREFQKQDETKKENIKVQLENKEDLHFLDHLQKNGDMQKAICSLKSLLWGAEKGQ